MHGGSPTRHFTNAPAALRQTGDDFHVGGSPDSAHFAPWETLPQVPPRGKVKGIGGGTALRRCSTHHLGDPMNAHLPAVQGSAS